MRNFFYYYDESENNLRNPDVGWNLQLVEPSKLQPIQNEIEGEVTDDD